MGKHGTMISTLGVLRAGHEGALTVRAGGPGSGCHGSNCGRPEGSKSSKGGGDRSGSSKGKTETRTTSKMIDEKRQGKSGAERLGYKYPETKTTSQMMDEKSKGSAKGATASDLKTALQVMHEASQDTGVTPGYVNSLMEGKLSKSQAKELYYDLMEHSDNLRDNAQGKGDYTKANNVEELALRIKESLSRAPQNWDAKKHAGGYDSPADLKQHLASHTYNTKMHYQQMDKATKEKNEELADMHRHAAHAHENAGEALRGRSRDAASASQRAYKLSDSLKQGKLKLKY